MICIYCAAEADIVRSGAATHAYFADWHCNNPTEYKLGHQACTGCDCQHEPVGTETGNPLE